MKWGHDESENSPLDFKSFTLPSNSLFENWVSCVFVCFLVRSGADVAVWFERLLRLLTILTNRLDT